MQAALIASNRVNLKLLHTFMMVAESSSFRGAADKVNRSQSAVSTQIKRLEQQLGVSLFNRTTRAVRLTPEGRELLGYAQKAVGEIEDGLRNIREAANIQQGLVILACSPTIACTKLPPVLSLFTGRFPNVRIQLQELKSADLFPKLAAGAIDFAIAPVTSDSRFDFTTIIEEAAHAFGAPQFLPGRTGTVSLAGIAELPIILFPSTTVLGQRIKQQSEKLGIALNVRYECVQAQTLIALAKSGLGVAITTHSVVSGEKAGTMRKPRILELAKQPFGIAKLKGKALSPTAASLANLIEAHFTGTLDPDPDPDKVRTPHE